MYVRLWELWKLSHLTGHIDALMSHDWPEYIAFFGNVDNLLRTNPFFKKSLDENTLGCEAYLALLKHLKPANWFSGHMHTRFTARVGHDVTSGSDKGHKDYVKMLSAATKFQKPAPAVPGSTPKKEAKTEAGTATQFLALDKPLPGRSYLEIVHFPFASGERESEPMIDLNGEPLPLAPRLCYDLDWLSIIRATHDLFPNHKGGARIPPSIHVNALAKHRDWIVQELLHGDANNTEALTISRANFVRSAAIHVEGVTAEPIRVGPGVGPQTALFLDWLQLDHARLSGATAPPSKPVGTPKATPSPASSSAAPMAAAANPKQAAN
jgi:lariat debranching enzyme